MMSRTDSNGAIKSILFGLRPLPLTLRSNCTDRTLLHSQLPFRTLYSINADNLHKPHVRLRLINLSTIRSIGIYMGISAVPCNQIYIVINVSLNATR